jgi:hypothetical protein
LLIDEKDLEMEGFEIVKSTHINGDFDGFDDEVLFKLTDGTYWIQDDRKYWYHHARRPEAKILRKDGRFYIQVDEQDEIVPVREASTVRRSKIKGEFKGWNGKSAYELLNGEIWEQASNRYKYKYAYMPNVTIYETPSGTVMDVAGTRAKVSQKG